MYRVQGASKIVRYTMTTQKRIINPLVERKIDVSNSILGQNGAIKYDMATKF